LQLFNHSSRPFALRLAILVILWHFRASESHRIWLNLTEIRRCAAVAQW
jgi:hypothetical protein